jgi:peroxiredoxin
MIEPGTPAPDFKLPDQDGNEVALEDLKGRKTVLVFYPSDFSRVCTDQLNVYQEVLPELEREGARMVGISVDSAFCHRAFRDQLGVTMPLLADFHPKGEVAKLFGVWSDEYGVSSRALFLLDEDGVVRWSYLSPPLEVPGANLIFDALAA